MSAFTEVLDRLERVKMHGDHEAIGSCPVPNHGSGNGDRHPSLGISHKEGRVLLQCHTGCETQDVVLALAMEWKDLFDEPLSLNAEYGAKVAEWIYQRPDGTPYFTVERWETPTGKRFVQRVPGHVHPPGHERAGKPKAGFPRGFRPCLFNLPKVLAEAAAGGTIYLVEGEKSVSAARHLGLVATCWPNGAKAWRDYYATWLQGAGQIFVVPDNDKDGLHYAAEIVANLRGKGLPCSALAVAVDQPKADLYDHVVAGFKVEDLRRINLNRLRPKGNGMDPVLTASYPAIRWVVPKVIPAGLSLLGGTVKIGKSMLALDLALGVACGGVGPVTRLPCMLGSVLYLSLDNDTESRIKDRTLHLLGRYVPDLPVEVHLSWPTGHEAVAAAQEWVEETTEDPKVPAPLLVVVDTLVRAEPAFDGDGRGGSSYSQAVSVLSRWADFAQSNQIGVVAVHHTRKGPGQISEGEDWIDRFLGSRGLVATAQTLLMIESERGSDTGILHVAGRDVRMRDEPMMREGWGWQLEKPPTVVGL